MQKPSWPGSAHSQQRWGLPGAPAAHWIQPGIPCLSPTSCLSPAVPTHIAPWEGLGSFTAEIVSNESFVSPHASLVATVSFVSQRPARFGFSCHCHTAEGHVGLGLAHAQAVQHWCSESGNQGAPINGFKPSAEAQQLHAFAWPRGSESPPITSSHTWPCTLAS